MKHCPRPPEQDDLLRPRLVDIIVVQHELVRLKSIARLEGVRTGMGWLLSLPKGSARNGTAIVCGVAVFAACLPTVIRGGGRALGREPVVLHFTRETFF